MGYTVKGLCVYIVRGMSDGMSCVPERRMHHWIREGVEPSTNCDDETEATTLKIASAFGYVIVYDVTYQGL